MRAIECPCGHHVEATDDAYAAQPVA